MDCLSYNILCMCVSSGIIQDKVISVELKMQIGYGGKDDEEEPKNDQDEQN